MVIKPFQMAQDKAEISSAGGVASCNPFVSGAN